MPLTNKTKQIIILESCKCICRLDPMICSNKQKWNKNKCRCECLINKECNNNKFWNPCNCECENRKKAAYLTEEWEEIIDDTATNKAIGIKKLVENCRPFVASSCLFLSVSVIVTGLFIHFYCKSKKKMFYHIEKRKEY